MKRVFVTGANGFVGTNLCKKLIDENFHVYGAVRPEKAYLLPEGVEAVHIKSIDGDTDWKNFLEGINIVVHLAARVHVMKDPSSNPFAEYRKNIVMGSERLALKAAECGVKRLIFMSSVKVNGEGKSTPYNEWDIQKPRDAYGISKWEAEKVLNKISKETEIEIVILRSPLVYGPRVKANFLRLLKLVDRGIPIPLASVKNRRSLIYIENLVDAIVTCMKHPTATGQTYFVSDGEDVSTPELIRRMGSALGCQARLFHCPSEVLKVAGRLAGKSTETERLTSSLTVDISKIMHELGWKPPFSMTTGLRETTEWYIKKGV